ncbi:MAG: histidine kinase [Chitinophagales bacterium]
MIFSKTIRKKYLGFDDTWLFIVGVPFFGLIIPLLFFNVDLSKNFANFHEWWIHSMYFVGGHWIVHRWALVRLRQKFPDFEDVQKRIVWEIITSIFLAFAWGALLKASIIFFVWCTDKELIKSYSYKQGVGITLMISFLIMSIYESIYFYTQLRQSIIEKEEVKQAHLRSQWQGLRNQVNPHFLFNSLNTLMSIVGDNPELAKQFLKKLSKVYRYILESREEPLIELQEELDFVQSYVFLQEERFRGNLHVQMNIPPQYMHHKIVPLSMQILFENTIKHNIISKNKPLTIEVFVNDQQKLQVRNNLQRKQQVMHSTKVGLENIKTRYRLFTEQSVDILETEDFFEVSLPLIGVAQVN